MMEIKKLIKGGQVAVIVSPGYGAGWSTWSSKCAEQMVFDPDIAEMILAKSSKYDIGELARKKYPGEYCSGITEAEVMWVSIGDRFEIEEYDGYESLKMITPDFGFTA